MASIPPRPAIVCTRYFACGCQQSSGLFEASDLIRSSTVGSYTTLEFPVGWSRIALQDGPPDPTREAELTAAGYLIFTVVTDTPHCGRLILNIACRRCREKAVGAASAALAAAEAALAAAHREAARAYFGERKLMDSIEEKKRRLASVPPPPLPNRAAASTAHEEMWRLYARDSIGETPAAQAVRLAARAADVAAERWALEAVAAGSVLLANGEIVPLAAAMGRRREWALTDAAVDKTRGAWFEWAYEQQRLGRL